MSRKVYITRWKEAASYQHGEGFPHAGGQAGQHVTLVMLVDSCAQNVGLYLSSQQKLHGNQIFNSLPCFT